MPSKTSKDFDVMSHRSNVGPLKVRPFIPTERSPMTPEVQKRIAAYRAIPSLHK